MSISSSLAHKYDEFDEVPQQSTPPKNAFEELKMWCEKYLTPEQYTIIPETENFYTTIYFNSRNGMGMADYIVFNVNKEYGGAGAVNYATKIEHMDEYKNADEFNTT